MRLPALLLSILATALIGCDQPLALDPAADGSPSLPVVPGNPGSSDPTEPSDPTGPPTPPPIVPVDPDAYALTLTGSFSTTGTSTGILFLTSGPAMWNQGTCTGTLALGTDGTWVSPTGQAGAARDPRCIAYWSDGHVGSNNRGSCRATARGFIGAWTNPGGHMGAPYHTKCLQRGTVSSTLVLDFTGSASLYVARDASGKRILDFESGGTVTGQLVYGGSSTGYTTGTGVVSAVDGGGATWTIDLGQAAFHWYTGVVNGDVTAALQNPGVEAVACSAATGCVIVMVSLGE